MATTAFLVKIATFDLIPVDYIDEELYYFPDGDALSLNLEQAGVESTLLLKNLGFMLWILVFNALLPVLHLLLLALCNKKCRFGMKLRLIIGNYLYFNGLTRLLMETFFEIALFSVLNLKTTGHDTRFASVRASQTLSYILLVIVIVTPPIIFIHYLRNKKHWAEIQFKAKWNTLINRLRLKDEEKKLLIIPAAFFARRAVFVCTVLLMDNFLWG